MTRKKEGMTRKKEGMARKKGNDGDIFPQIK